MVKRFFFRLRDRSCVLLVVTYSQVVRTALWNICRIHDEVVVRQLGRTALLGETELTALFALRLREKHDEGVQIEQIQPFNEFVVVPGAVREAAVAYKDRESPVTPHSKFASGTGHPSAAEMQRREL